MKTHVITLSKTFMKSHPRAGKPTLFPERFALARKCSNCGSGMGINGFCHRSDCQWVGHPMKLHTIRANYQLWEKRMKEIQAGKAVFSVRQWTGAPYRSKQRVLANLTAEDGVGIQRLTINYDLMRSATVDGSRLVELPELARNDGLSFDDWYNWFKGYDLKLDFVIIHFTKFRY